MAPRKPKVVSVTKKKKVVEETVKVTVTEGGDPNVTTEITENDDQETQDLTFSLPVGENVTSVEIPVEARDERSPQPPETPASTSEGTVKKKTSKVQIPVEVRDERSHQPPETPASTSEGTVKKKTSKVEIPVEVRDERSPQPPENPASVSEGTVKKKTSKVEIPVEVRDERSPQPLETPAPTSEDTVKKKTNKVVKKQAKKKKKRDDLAGDEYRRYVYKVMKQVHPDLGITSKAMTVVNMFMGDMFERIAQEAAKLGDYTKRRTLSSREIEAAVRLVLPGELSRHAVAEGSKAVSNYVAYDSRKR